MFFVRGAWSIDQAFRTPGFDWFVEEQLSYEELGDAVLAYAELKPEIMLSHEAPYSLLPYLNLNVEFAQRYGHTTNMIPTRTNLALDNMFKTHKPKLWVLGHYHRYFDQVIDGTRFVILTADSKYQDKPSRSVEGETVKNPLQYLDIEI